MFDPKMLDEIATKLSGSLPSGLQELQGDFEKNARTTLQSALGKLDLVTREEFEVQSQVLARTRSKLEALETQVAALEAQMSKDDTTQ
jgi:BMFP domain-containing protein YqiC